MVVSDASTGKVILETNLDDETNLVFHDDGSVTLVDPTTGEELTTVTPEEINDAVQQACEEARIEQACFGEEEETQTTPVIWFSPDGEGWTSLAIVDTFGPIGIEGYGSEAYPSDLVVGEGAVILCWSDRIGFVDDSEEEIEDLPDIVWVGRVAGWK